MQRDISKEVQWVERLPKAVIEYVIGRGTCKRMFVFVMYVYES